MLVKMITELIANLQVSNSMLMSKFLAHILGRIDYDAIVKGLKKQQNGSTVVVLMEYVHSGVYETIAEIERFPGTTYPVDLALNHSILKYYLVKLFGDKPGMKVYTRRKIDFSKPGMDGLTKYKQLVLRLDEMPSAVQSVATTECEDVE